MRIAYISAGAGGMLCGACLHDNTLAAALQSRGHDVALVPIYTPLRTDEANVSIDQVFFGAINVSLQQRSALFRRTPRLLDRLLDRPGLLRWVSRFASTIDARQLGDMTVSMLQGEAGRQRKELARLVRWLTDAWRPDVVHLTNSLLLGLARPLRRELGVPLICSLQGEEIFLQELPEPHRSRVTAAMRERAADADLFVAPCRDYAGLMQELLGCPPERMRVVPLGLKLEGHGAVAPQAPAPAADGPFVIGYLARVCPEKGLHLLAEAFRSLAAERPVGQVRLHVAGWLGERDRPYLHGVRERIAGWGLASAFEYRGELDREGKIAFLQGIHVLSVPSPYREPKGLSVLEALANGTPAVQPAHGAFPELLELTGGGLLFEPGSVPALTDALRSLRDDPARRGELGRRGRAAVHAGFSDVIMAERTLEVYREALSGGRGQRAATSAGPEAAS